MFSYIAWKDDYFYWLVTYQFYWAVFWKEKKRRENRNERIQHQVQLIQTWFFINAKYNKKKIVK